MTSKVRTVRWEALLLSPRIGIALLCGVVTVGVAAPPRATAQATPPSAAASSTTALAARVAEDTGPSMAARLARVTEPLLGAPYVLSPLGEGAPPDADPRFRTDAFDCTTFVETAIALAHARSLDDAPAILDRVRYRRGEPSFANRRHFPEAEWIPELIADGTLEDVTRAVAGDEAIVEKKQLTRETWAARKNKILSELDDARLPYGTHTLPAWPLERAQLGASKIPPGTVLSVIRQDVRVMPVRVSHQGLVVEKNGKLFMRHAADKIFHKVVDEPLESYLARLARSTKWPVTSVHLAKVRERPAR